MNKPVRARQKDKKTVPRGPRKAIVIANGIAAVFMFASWLAQNVYQSELESTKSNIEKDVQFSNSEMIKALQWMLTLKSMIQR